jgi:hypothetical protein
MDIEKNDLTSPVSGILTSSTYFTYYLKFQFQFILLYYVRY